MIFQLLEVIICKTGTLEDAGCDHCFRIEVVSETVKQITKEFSKIMMIVSAPQIIPARVLASIIYLGYELLSFICSWH
jgi:hypothetical protein